jgi:hypothetical protein
MNNMYLKLTKIVNIDMLSLNKVIEFGCIWKEKHFQHIRNLSCILDNIDEYNTSPTLNISNIFLFDVRDD